MQARKTEQGKQTLYLGIDTHKTTWHVTGMLENGEEMFRVSMASEIVGLLRYLERWRHYQLAAVYEAGYFGFTLHDELEAAGIACIVTPPSLLPSEYGNRVKTDRRDSRKLALLFAKGFLKRVYVPTPEERVHRQVVRSRRMYSADRRRKQCQIKAYLAFHGIPLPDITGRWSRTFVAHLHAIRFEDRWLQRDFTALLHMFEVVDTQVEAQTELIQELAADEKYRERVALLLQLHGIGVLTAMEMLVELQDIERFRTGEQMAAYLGLTPSQFSSGENIRMGHITRIGKAHLRGTLIEAAWVYVRKDRKAAETFAALRSRIGTKRAIVAMARRLVLLSRSILIHRSVYQPAA